MLRTGFKSFWLIKVSLYNVECSAICLAVGHLDVLENTLTPTFSWRLSVRGFIENQMSGTKYRLLSLTKFLSLPLEKNLYNKLQRMQT